MISINPEIENYIVSHSDKEDPILSELFRETQLKVLNPKMISGFLQGKVLEFISKLIKPEQILEIGTFTGYSAICLSKGLQPNGQLHTIELNDELEHISKKYFKKSNLENKIVQYIGNALDIIPGIDKTFDLVFIDGEKTEYIQYYNLVIEKVKKDGIILVDNVLWSGKVIDENENDPSTLSIRAFNSLIKKDTKVEKLIVPIRDGIMILRKK